MDHNVSFPDAEKIKGHFRKNKDRYLFFGLGAVVVLAFRRPVSIAPVFNNSNTVITELSRRGHPGFILKCNETGEVFASIARAADVMGLNRPNVVSHLKGRVPHVGGYTFEMLGEAV